MEFSWVKNLQSFLGIYSRSVCYALALMLAVVLTVHIATGSVIPIADGEGYGMRTFALYGYLHTGQWDEFGKLLARPAQSILPPHDLLFFLLPASLAGTVTYAALLEGTTFLLLAYAVGKAAQVLNRPAWAPVIFLLVSVNNIALMDFYDFYLDMMFCAFGFLVIALQMNAWKENRTQTSMVSGVALGLLFFVKPANALIFLVTYVLSELFYAIAALRSVAAKEDRRPLLINIVRQTASRLAGFLPVIFLVYLCGGVDSILQLIEQNEVHEQFTPVAVGGLLRLFYFPLYLTVFYHVLILGGLILVASALSQWGPFAKRLEPADLAPMRYFIPIALAYLIFGEFFSFWMLVKPMRALLLMLPLCGFAFCWWWEQRRFRFEPLVFVVLIYTCAAFSQKAYDIFGTRDQLVEDNYQLVWQSWAEMPSPWHRTSNLNLSLMISNFIEGDLPPAGVVCVNAIEMRNALAWRLNNEPLLSGKGPRYQVRNLFNYKGDYYVHALNGASVVALITFRPVQSTRTAWLQSMGILDYGNDEWVGKGLARISDMPSIEGEAIGYDFIFDHPLTQADVDLANRSAPFATAPKDTNIPPDTFYGKHYSRAEAWQLLQTWFAKRFD